MGAEGAGPPLGRVEVLLVGALLLALPLATAGQEIACGLLLAHALVTRPRALGASPFAGPGLAVAAAWLLAVPASGDLHEGLGHAWLLAPLVALRPVSGPTGERLVRVGLYAAAAAGVWAVVQAAGGAQARAGFSHHLTLAYALLPPLGVALARREWPAALLIAAGVVATGSRGAIPAAAAVLLATHWPARPGGVARGGPLLAAPFALGAGALATLTLLATAAPADDLRQRAVLWTGSLSLLDVAPVGPGAYARASAPRYDQLEPGFWFPNHAHDAAAQVLVVLGPLGLAAFAWLVVRLLTRASPGAAAGAAGVLVGALTQDVLGDLEVVRAMLIWAAVLPLVPPAGLPVGRQPGGDGPAPGLVGG